MSTLMPSAAVAPYAIAPYSDAWREKYGKSRYLQFLSIDGLQQRYVDLLDNVLGFGHDGKPQFVALDTDTGMTRRIADLRAEVDLRQLEFEWLVSVEQAVLQKPYPQIPRALEVWGNRQWIPESCLIKYGNRKHMAELAERGCMRLTPASCYKDSSLNSAIQDSELEFAVHFPPGTKLRVEMEPGSGIFQDIPGMAGLITHTRSCEDFHVFCASATFDPRMFDDFGYDACVLIHDWQRFADAIKSLPVPARKLSVGSTVYLDPFMSHRHAEVSFAKHFRYGYQREWRMVWTEPYQPLPLKPILLELGDLRSYCELITL